MFARQTKVGQFFRVFSHLLYKANLIKNYLDFDNICLSEQTYSILRILSHLVYRESLSIQSLIIFTIQIKLDQNLDFDYICLSEQTYSILII